MLNQASWKSTNVSLPVFFGLRHVACMVFLIPVTFAWIRSLCFINFHILVPPLERWKDILTQLFPWDLQIVTWVQSLQEKLKKKIEENKAAFQFFFNPSGVTRQEWCNFQSCGQLQLSLMYFVDSSMDASSLAFGNRIWKCHPKVPLSAKWP